MSLRTQTIDPLTDERWQTHVAANRRASIFHHVEWLRLLHSQYRYRMLAHCVLDPSGDIVVALPFAHVTSRLTGNRLVALPFSDLCPILSGGAEDEDAVELLVRSLRDEHERLGINVEVRTALSGIPASGKAFYQHEIALDADVDVVSRRFRGNVRRDVARAGREGIEVRRGTSIADLDAFYSLHLRTRRRQGVPTQPQRFIRRFGRLFDADLGFVILATLDDVPVASAVCLKWGDTLTYKYSASEPEYMKKRPNYAILMEAIRCGCEAGLTTLDLGRTDLDNEGLRTFKRGWGSVEHELTYGALSRKPRSNKGSTGVPRIARTLISRTPPIAGRLAGVALYRHFG